MIGQEESRDIQKAKGHHIYFHNLAQHCYCDESRMHCLMPLRKNRKKTSLPNISLLPSLCHWSCDD